MPIKFKDVEVGDTLKAGRRPHYAKNNTKTALFKTGEELMVKKKHTGSSGIQVSNKAGVVADYYFTDGESKLEYTPDTIAKIKQRQAWDKEEKATKAQMSPDEMREALVDLHRQVQEQGDLQEEVKALRAELQKLNGGKPDEEEKEQPPKPPVLRQQQQQRPNGSPSPRPSPQGEGEAQGSQPAHDN